MGKISNILDLLKVKCLSMDNSYVISASPACGWLFVTNRSPHFISGHVRLKGRENGRYPYNYLEMIENLFGEEKNIIEVCSGSIQSSCFTVDINPDANPVLVDDGQELAKVAGASYNRWRCDPPYNIATAQKMYGTELPNTGRLLKAGTRVCKEGSLLFLLLGPQNYQIAPPGVQRIGWIAMTIVPNNELRALHIFYKYSNIENG